MTSRVRSGCGSFALSIVFFAAAGLAACGDGAADNVAVQVGRTSITTTTVAHWMSVIAGEVSTAPGQPKPEVPVPPDYASCVAYRRTYPTVPGQSTPTPEHLKQECELEFQKEKLKALYFLISYAWVKDEASQLGVHLPNQTLAQEIAVLKAQFPNEAALRRFLVGTRGTVMDLMLRLRLNLLTTEVQRKLEHERGEGLLTVAQRQQALNMFSEMFVKRWTARTACRPGYVVPLCSRYRRPRVAPALVPPSVPLTRMTAE
jgi:hypothetical protein